MKTHGDEGWKDYPSYYDIFIPYVLNLLSELDIKITFFIVGRDAIDINNKNYLRKISEDGHDIGNHSFSHEVWINQYSKDQFEADLIKAEQAIFEATGKKTNGFRGPGFSWNKTMLEVLSDRQYLYDSSTLPTFIGPFARMYYFHRSKFSVDEMEKRESLFGPFSAGFRSLKPYFFVLKQDRKLLEIPITTIPVLRTPFHMSYLLYLSLFSSLLMKGYLYFAIFMCKITRTPINFLLHPLDIIGGDKTKELVFFPGMNIKSEKKVLVFREIIEILKRNYNLVDMNTYALAILKSKKK